MEIPLTPCTSSRIAAHGYDQATNTLALQFKKKGDNGEQVPGAVYQYANVEPELYRDLCAAESKGKFFGEHINIKVDGKLKYPFTKIEAKTEEIA